MIRYRDFINSIQEMRDYKIMMGTVPRKMTLTVAETGKKVSRNVTVHGGNYAAKVKGKWVYVYDVNGKPTVFQKDAEGSGLHITNPKMPR